MSVVWIFKLVLLTRLRLKQVVNSMVSLTTLTTELITVCRDSFYFFVLKLAFYRWWVATWKLILWTKPEAFLLSAEQGHAVPNSSGDETKQNTCASDILFVFALKKYI